MFDVSHFGEKLLELIRAAHMQKNEFCKKADISADRFYKAVKKPTPIVKPATYRLMAEALDMTPEQLDAAWKDDAGHGPAPAEVNPNGKEDHMPTFDQIVAGVLGLKRQERDRIRLLLKTMDEEEKQNAAALGRARTRRKTA